jgi:hypothetical protein
MKSGLFILALGISLGLFANEFKSPAARQKPREIVRVYETYVRPSEVFNDADGSLNLEENDADYGLAIIQTPAKSAPPTLAPTLTTLPTTQPAIKPVTLISIEQIYDALTGFAVSDRDVIKEPLKKLVDEICPNKNEQVIEFIKNGKFRQLVYNPIAQSYSEGVPKKAYLEQNFMAKKAMIRELMCPLIP